MQQKTNLNENKALSTAQKLLGRTEMPVLAAVLILGIIFSISSENFFSAYNIFNMSRDAALYMFIALSQAMVIIVGGMNLSLGYISGLAVVASGAFMQDMGLPTYLAYTLALAVGCLSGYINGVLIIKLKLNAFIVTLATSFIYRGLVTGISQGFPYTELAPSAAHIGRGRVFGSPVPVMLILSAIVLTALWYFFTYTIPGRKMLATGGNETAAKMAAVNTDNSIILANTLSGLFAAMAGVCAVSMGDVAQPTTGSDWMIYSFAVAVIGGTLLKGGVFNSVGIFIAAYLIVMIKNGLVMVEANYYYEQTYLGLILLFAVSLATIISYIKDFNKRRQFLKEHNQTKK